MSGDAEEGLAADAFDGEVSRLSRLRARFYADENVDEVLIRFLRSKGQRIESARELGFTKRDDEFHLQEARRRKCVLLTNDTDFLDHRRFPFAELQDTAIVILRTTRSGSDVNFGFLLVALEDEVAASGIRNLRGLKIEVQGPRMTCHALVNGRICTDSIDISKPRRDRMLFGE